MCTNESLAGTWKWQRTDGGIAFHIHETPASTGKNIELVLTADGKYRFLTNGSISSQGNYQLSTQKSIRDHEQKTFIDFSSISDRDMLVEKFDANELHLSDNAYDGVGSVYTRH